MATDAPVTFYNSLEEIYVKDSLLAQGKRWDDLATAFKAEHGHAPSDVVRAPGRINLIGEHIDYCLFGVMPAAVEFDTLVAFSTEAPAASLHQAKAEGAQCSVSLSNVDPRWKRVWISARLASGADEPEEERWDVGLVDQRLDGWDGYVRAALAEVLDNFFPSQPDTLPPHLNLMVSGNIPPGSGLSSSAALIVATTLAMLVAYGVVPAQHVSNAQLVRLACDAELRLGLKNGGMDQSASVLGRPGAGLYISFWPQLGVEAVALPSVRTEHGHEPLVMVVANSLETHSLANDAKRQYNLRVVETLVAARLLWHGLGLDGKRGADATPVAQPHRPTLREVLARHMDEAHASTLSHADLERALEEMLEQVERVLGDDARLRTEGFVVHEMAERSGMSEDEFERTYMTHIEVEADTFHIYNRAKHVYSESLRVLQFRRIALAAAAAAAGGGASEGDVAAPSEQPAHQLGRLMDASHASGRDAGDISVPAVDRLVELCKEAGAVGSRMSGGGWGGCTVSLIPASREADFIARITDATTGYAKYAGLDAATMRDVVFKSVPGSGAGVMKL